MHTPLKEKIREAGFRPSALSCLINPSYIIRRELFRAISLHSNQAHGELLDFGCGSKPYEALFSNVSHYVGCDIESSGHDHATSKVDYFYDGMVLPFRDASFDWVVSFEVIDDIFNLDVILKELHRVTKPGGFLLLTTPFCWQEQEAPYDFARYTSYGLPHILERSGFHVVDYQKTGSYTLCIFQLIQYYLYQYIFPKKFKINRLLTPVVIFPLTVVAYGLNAILPKSKDFFLNSVVLCERKAALRAVSTETTIPAEPVCSSQPSSAMHRAM